ncbi:MAG: ribonuclease J [Acholeplasmatales bacterium]|nr:ribonuclease J [Acholeplasmatales bacterium]
MSKIKFFALGGLQEIGKNMYVVDVDDKLFIFDCGLKYPTSQLYGVDLIVNDISYIEKNSSRVAGVFLSNANSNYIGGISYLLKNHNYRVFGSKLTLAVLKDTLKENDIPADKNEFVEINCKTVVNFPNVVVRFFEVPSDIPDSYGIALKTNDGYIIYTSCYNFDQNSKINYDYLYRSLAVFSKEGVLALLTDSLGANSYESRGTIQELTIRIHNIITSSKGRIIFSVFSSDILRIQHICNIALEHNKKIAVIGRKTQKIVNEAINLGYINIPEESFANLRFIDEKNNNFNNDPNLVVLVTGERHEPFYMLQRMARDADRLIHLEEDDTIIILTNPTLGTEKMASKTLDIIYHKTSNIKLFNSSLLPTKDANREEIKQMINILKPKYIIPVIGEYRHQYALRIVANCVGYTDDKILICDNGDVVTFDDGVLGYKVSEVECGEMLIDGKAFDEVGDVVMKDRDLLADDGLIIITANINPRTKTIVAGPDVVMKGFIFIKDNLGVINKIKELFYLVSNDFLAAKFVNWNEFKTAIRNEISHYIYKEMKRNPIIIPVLISTEVVK